LFKVLFNKFSKHLQMTGAQVHFTILWVGVKHENLVLPHQVVNNPYAASLAASTTHPPNLAESSCLGDEVASFRIGDENGL
jgi:hypothetical protein